MTRIVHTADWHLGARLAECGRHDEHVAFLDWFLQQVSALRPDLVIVAGDIFDSSSPPQDGLQLYYSFLSRLAAAAQCQTLILGGNHDSPATLHAPRDVLRALDVRVIASPPEQPEQALLEFPDAVVCAVPYLRERDVRTAAPGQSPDEVAAAIRQGIHRHYRAIHELALARAHGRRLVATGHLTAAGTASSPSERSIVGNLDAVDASCFDGFDYVALGHLHRPQPVGAHEHVRYAGSPLPLSFAEVDAPKEIRIVDITGAQLTHRAIAVPEFRPLVRLASTAAGLAAELAQRQAAPGATFPPWIELTVTDGRAQPDLDRQVRDAAAGLRLRVLKVLTPPAPDAADTEVTAPPPALSDLRPEDVFVERLRRATIAPESPEGRELVQSFEELLRGMHDADPAEPTGGPP